MTLYLPLGVFLFVLLFPFYWMVITSFKPNAELLSREGNPFWVKNPTLAHFKKLLFDTPYPDWMWNTIVVSVVGDVHLARCSRACSRPTRSSGCASAAPATSASAIFLAYLVPPSILFIPLAAIVFKLRPLRHALGADPHLSDVPDPVLHLAADGLLPLDPLSSWRSAR